MAIDQAELRDLLTKYRQENWHRIQTPEWQQRIVEDMLQDHAPAVLHRIAAHWNIPPDPLILDLGSGVGNFVVACRKQGFRAYGVEPDQIGSGSRLTSLQIAGKRLDAGCFAAAIGEQLPFADGTFDLVVLDQVIEHVQDQKSVLAEAFRVVKPTGALYLACPNYLRSYEPHYKLWFLPLMPKFLGSWYLRMRGRDPVLLYQINYTTNWKVRRLLHQQLGKSIDLNRETFLQKSGSVDAFVSARGRLLGRMIRDQWLGKGVLKCVLFYIRLRERGSEFLIHPEASKPL